MNQRSLAVFAIGHLHLNSNDFKKIAKKQNHEKKEREQEGKESRQARRTPCDTAEPKDDNAAAAGLALEVEAPSAVANDANNGGDSNHDWALSVCWASYRPVTTCENKENFEYPFSVTMAPSIIKTTVVLASKATRKPPVMFGSGGVGWSGFGIGAVMKRLRQREPHECEWMSAVSR
jgi:hypothetical protein